MRIVVDTSVLIAVIANEPIKPAIVRATRGAVLLAPASVHWEIGNAFSAMLKRGRVRMAQVKKALEAYAQIPIRFFDVELLDALEVAESLMIYAYDAYVLACARVHRCPVLTLDEGLVEAAERAEVQVMEP